MIKNTNFLNPCDGESFFLNNPLTHHSALAVYFMNKVCTRPQKKSKPCITEINIYMTFFL